MSATLPRDPELGRYGRPVIKQPVWKPQIPLYFYAGGLAGASAGLAGLSELRGDDALARRAWATALLGAMASTGLLITDLGKPSRFLNMLRMLKVTSPMSMGAWLLSGFSAAAAVATLDAWGVPVPTPVGTGAKGTAAVLGMPLATYTAALISNTAVPVWHDARRTLPVVFAAGAAASAGAAGMATTPPGDAAPARRLAVGGAAAELAAVAVMERRLAPRVARPYHEGKAQGLGRVAKGCLAAGCVASATAGARSLAGARIGAALVTAGAVLERWSVFTAGSQSAADPRATVDPQRARMAAGQQARH